MARERPVRPDDEIDGSDRGRPMANAVGRRTYLRLTGATATVGCTLAGLGTVAGDTGGDDREVIDIDYDDHYDPSAPNNGLGDIYRVWNVRSGTVPDITSDVSRSGQSCCAHHLHGNQMSANTVYPFDRHHGDEVDEVYQRFSVHPNGTWLSANNTMRFFWLGLRNGPESSGAGWSAPHSGTDGWSVRAGFTRRQDHGHPDTYTFFVYSYDMRLRNGTVPSIEYGTGVQVPTNEWVTVESYQKLNSYGPDGPNRDGELRVWVNDELAYEHDSLAWRSTAGQGIQEAGPHGYDLYRDNDPHTIYFDDHRIVVGEDLDPVDDE